MQIFDRALRIMTSVTCSTLRMKNTQNLEEGAQMRNSPCQN
jgi:hypothetical protein